MKAFCCFVICLLSVSVARADEFQSRFSKFLEESSFVSYRCKFDVCYTSVTELYSHEKKQWVESSQEVFQENCIVNGSRKSYSTIQSMVEGAESVFCEEYLSNKTGKGFAARALKINGIALKSSASLLKMQWDKTRSQPCRPYAGYFSPIDLAAMGLEDVLAVSEQNVDKLLGFRVVWEREVKERLHVLLVAPNNKYMVLVSFARDPEFLPESLKFFKISSGEVIKADTLQYEELSDRASYGETTTVWKKAEDGIFVPASINMVSETPVFKSMRFYDFSNWKIDDSTLNDEEIENKEINKESLEGFDVKKFVEKFESRKKN